MWPLITSVALASLLGSMHCVGMCGPLMLLATGASGRPAHGALYHSGRLLSYLLLGLAAGGLGSVLDLGGTLLGFQRVALTLSAVFLVGFGVKQLLQAKGWWPQKTGKHGTSGWLTSARKQVLRWPPTRRAFGVGALSGLLPCGWLFAFVAVAAGSGHALAGAALMGAFWIGTVPLLAAVGLGAGRIAPNLQRRFPLAIPLLLIASGLFVLQGRTAVAAPQWDRAAQNADPHAELDRAIHTEPSCCSGDANQAEQPHSHTEASDHSPNGAPKEASEDGE